MGCLKMTAKIKRDSLPFFGEAMVYSAPSPFGDVFKRLFPPGGEGLCPAKAGADKLKQAMSAYGRHRLFLSVIDWLKLDFYCHIHSPCQPLQGFQRGVCVSVFQFADIRLGDTGFFG